MPTINSWDSNIPVEISKDGTNATTMATSNGTVIYDGTRLVTTAVGTAGQVLTSNGASAPTYQQAIQFSTVTLTSAQIKALHASPITMVNAPGANKMIVPVQCGMKYLYGGSDVFVAAAAQQISMYWDTFAGELIMGLTTNTNLIGTSTVYYFILPAPRLSKAVGKLDNVPVVLQNPVVTEISGNAANDNKTVVSLAYYIADLN